MKEIVIHKNEAGQRFDKYLKKLLKEATGSFIYKMLRKKNIVLNGKKADGSEKLSEGDTVKLFLADETYDKFTGNTGSQEDPLLLELREIPEKVLSVVYEDEDILVINKPSGMLSQKAEKTDVSANEYILRYLLDQGTITKEELKTFRPSVCNRLDRNTSGLLIAGKTLAGLQDMSRQLKERDMEKYYRCMVKGVLKQKQDVEGYLTKNERTNQVKIHTREVADSKYIRTSYEPIAVYGGYTLLEVHLITGRSHQIRAHLASQGYPIIGDTKYGDTKVNQYFAQKAQIRNQMLHAYRMVLSNQQELTAPLPAEFERVRKLLQKEKI